MSDDLPDGLQLGAYDGDIFNDADAATYRQEVGDFRETLDEIIREIHDEAYRYVEVNTSIFRPSELDLPHDDPTLSPGDNRYEEDEASFYGDINDLTAELAKFDEGSVDAWRGILEEFRLAAAELWRAKEYGSANITDELGSWTGPAARSFKEHVNQTFDSVIGNQVTLVRELVAAVTCIIYAMERYQHDVLGIAEQIRAKLKEGNGSAGGSMSLSFGDLLRIVGAVAAGIAAATATGGTSLAAWTAWAVNSASTAYSLIENAPGEPSQPGRSISGSAYYPWEFIEGAWDVISELRRSIYDEVAHIRAGLSDDLERMRAADPGRDDRMGFDPTHQMEPDDDFGDFEGSIEADLATVRTVAVGHLPAFAQYYEEARSRLDTIQAESYGAYPYATFSYGLKSTLDLVVGDFERLLGRTRDYAYESGEALKHAVDAYDKTEQENREMMEAFESSMDGLEGPYYDGNEAPTELPRPDDRPPTS